MKQARLGVNIDHVATVRQARKTAYPDPVEAALMVETAGCFSIVAHLREDRRHIQDQDIRLLKQRLTRSQLNLEMSIAPEIVRIATQVIPYQATLVPEKRRELTTEGGLDLTRSAARVGRVVEMLKKKGIKVSLFIDPSGKQVKEAYRIGADMIEFHTGAYADATTAKQRAYRLEQLEHAIESALQTGFSEIAVGHGLNYENIHAVARINTIDEFNIGHSIIAASVFFGLTTAVKNMSEAIEGVRASL